MIKCFILCLGSKDRYFQDVEDDIKKLVPEGIVGRVPYKAICMKASTSLLEVSEQGWDIVAPKIFKPLKRPVVL